MMNYLKLSNTSGKTPWSIHKKMLLLILILILQNNMGFAQGKKENEMTAKDKKVVRYEDFGAVGDGKDDDIEAIAKAHEYANKHGLPVKANDNATYYIGGKDKTAYIQTDTDFGNSKFIIDDRNVENRGTKIFHVCSNLESTDVKGLTSLKRNQKKIDVAIPGSCLITVTDSNVKQYIRKGANQNNGSSQTDIFLVDADGNVDMRAPIIWDFEKITSVKALPIDTDTLTVKGGHFTTIANQAESKYTYYKRGITISRSNVKVIGIQHYVKGEGDHGAPYNGFINITKCANVTVKDSILTGRKTYRTIGSAGRPVSMGSYDISPSKALNVSFINCRQSNDIKDRKYWGIMGSNYSKNMIYDGCEFSRFDAHKGVANATIRNSKLGYMGIQAIGSGTLTIENSTVYGRSFVNLRPDYGSTWQGELIIRDSVFIPACGASVSACLIGGRNEGNHYFGYTCYMPERITIENLIIDDSNHSSKYQGPTIFANFNSKLGDPKHVEKFPIVRPKEVFLKNVKTKSGKPLRVSDNSVMFKDVRITRPDKK